MTVAERIRALREAKGWSSGQLAKAAEVSRGYLWQLETGGKDRPSVDILERLAEALGVEVTEILGQTQAETPKAALPPGLLEFIRARGTECGVQKSDVEVLKNIHFRGSQPHDPGDWELLFRFLQKWARS